MNIHMITEEDPFYIPVFFREFLDNLPRRRFRLTGVDVTPALNRRTRRDLAKKLYDFYGLADFTRLVLRYARVKMKDLLSPGAGTLGKLLSRHGVASDFVPDVNDERYIARLRLLEPDLLISVAASQIFGEPLLSLPKTASLNIHSGRLPEYRGMFPVFWQMYDRRPRFGVTIHTMTPTIDIGDIVLRRTVPVSGLTCLDAAIRRMKTEGARAMLDLLDQYRTGSVRPVPMEMAAQKYRGFPGRVEARRFRAMGYRLL